MAKFAVLNCNKDFRTLYYRGKSQVHPGLVTYVRRNRLGTPRAGITTGKKVGNAVRRSRCRRVIREAKANRFPESNRTPLQFLLMVWGLLPAMAGHLRERVLGRRKAPAFS